MKSLQVLVLLKIWVKIFYKKFCTPCMSWPSLHLVTSYSRIKEPLEIKIYADLCYYLWKLLRNEFQINFFGLKSCNAIEHWYASSDFKSFLTLYRETQWFFLQKTWIKKVFAIKSWSENKVTWKIDNLRALVQSAIES